VLLLPRLFRFFNVMSRFEGAFFLSYSSAAIVKFIMITVRLAQMAFIYNCLVGSGHASIDLLRPWLPQSFATHWAACLFVAIDHSYCAER
jgi:hypothetical protein